MALAVLQIGAEVAPLATGDLAENATALARALADHDVSTTLIALAPAGAEGLPRGFARRLRKLVVGADEVDVFEGSLARGVASWLLHPPPGRSPREVLALGAAAAVVDLDIPVTVAHAHGADAVAALDEVGRVRPSTVRVATVTDPVGVDASADAVVVPALDPPAGAIGIAPGIDDSLWNPETDPALPARFSAAEPAKKAICRRALQRALLLAPRSDVPLLATSTESARKRVLEALSEGRFVPVQLASPTAVSLRMVLGAADYFIATEDEGDATNVLRAMRYGAVPLVPEGSPASARVVQYDGPTRTGSGLLFDAAALPDCVFRAGQLFSDGETMNLLRTRALCTDVSWRGPAQRYLDLFERLSRE